MKHPVFEQEFDFKGKYGLNLSEDRVFELKKIFAIANLNGSGVIGRKQFTDLMALLRIQPTEVRPMRYRAASGEEGGLRCGAQRSSPRRGRSRAMGSNGERRTAASSSC